MNSSRPKKIEADLISKYSPEEKSVFEDRKTEKISIPESFDTQIELKPRKNDIDFNHHVHNLVYLDYAMEVLPENVYSAHDFKEVKIAYKSAVKEDSVMEVKCAAGENKNTVCIFEDGKLSTIMKFESRI